MSFLLKMGIFDCYVSLAEGSVFFWGGVVLGVGCWWVIFLGGNPILAQPRQFQT